LVELEIPNPKTPDLCTKCRHRYYRCSDFREIQGINKQDELVVCNKFKKGHSSRVLAWIFNWWFPHLHFRSIMSWLRIKYLRNRMGTILLSHFILKINLECHNAGII
jgi:hypothetical protein